MSNSNKPNKLCLIVLWGWIAGAIFEVHAADQLLATAPVEGRRVAVEQVFDGLIEPAKQSTVAAQIVGRVVEINFDVDAVVPKDGIIIRFHDAEQRARLEQEQAGLREAQARLTEATLAYDRVKSIYERQLIAKSELDKAEAALGSAKARVEVATASVKAAEEQLDHTVVRAPFSGIVVERHVELGETTQIGQPLMTGLAVDHLRMQVDVPQGLIETIRSRDRARIVLDDGRSMEIKGLTVFPYAAPVSQTVRIRADLPRGIKGVYPGVFIKVAFAIGEEQRLLVPRRAVVQRSEVTAVYVVGKDGRVSMRHVRTGKIHGDMIEMLAGVEAGERIALDPVQAGIVLKQQQKGGGL